MLNIYPESASEQSKGLTGLRRELGKRFTNISTRGHVLLKLLKEASKFQHTKGKRWRME